jgi:hypothetical protein
MRFEQGLFEYLVGINREIPDENIVSVKHILPGDCY